MSDPLLVKTRKGLTDCSSSEPTLSASINRRVDSLFEDGFNLELEIAQVINPATAKEYTDEEKAIKLQPLIPTFLPSLVRLAIWSNKINILDSMCNVLRYDESWFVRKLLKQ